jgi:hypothetical protein
VFQEMFFSFNFFIMRKFNFLQIKKISNWIEIGWRIGIINDILHKTLDIVVEKS